MKSNQSDPNIFQYQQYKINVYTFDGKPVFIAQQVGAVLGVKDAQKGIRDSKHLQKGVEYDVVSSKILKSPEPDSDLSGQNVTILYESGLYAFILRSDKPAAIEFYRWVIRDVIPNAMRELVSSNGFSTPLNDPKTSITPSILKLMELENKGSKFAAKALTDLGFAPTVQQLELPLEKGGANA